MAILKTNTLNRGYDNAIYSLVAAHPVDASATIFNLTGEIIELSGVNNELRTGNGDGTDLGQLVVATGSGVSSDDSPFRQQACVIELMYLDVYMHTSVDQPAVTGSGGLQTDYGVIATSLSRRDLKAAWAAVSPMDAGGVLVPFAPNLLNTFHIGDYLIGWFEACLQVDPSSVLVAAFSKTANNATSFVTRPIDTSAPQLNDFKVLHDATGYHQAIEEGLVAATRQDPISHYVHGYMRGIVETHAKMVTWIGATVMDIQWQCLLNVSSPSRQI